MYDIVLKNGTIIDGTNKTLSYIADIGIYDDKIIEIGMIEQEENVIDVTGKYVVPGFIDPHSHADCSLFLYPECESYLRQGITTFVGGQCGDSNAPIYNYWMRKYWEYDMWHDIDPFIYDAQTIQPVDKVLDVVCEKTGEKISWKSFGEYLNVLENKGIGCNMISLVGHSQIRADVMGLDQRRDPTDEEMKKMKANITEAMESGAWGLSTGRDYPPSACANIEEIMELVNHVKKYDGYYFTHWRSTGTTRDGVFKPNKIEGIKEALDICLATGVKTEISHLMNGYDIYPESPEMDICSAKATLNFIDEYIRNGADVAFDVIPGISGGIRIMPYLASYFIPWIKQSGSLSQFVTNLKAKDYKKRLVELIQNGKWYNINPKSSPLWDKKIFITKSSHKLYIGKSIYDIAIEKCKNSIEVAIDLLIEEPKIMVERNGKSHEEIRGLLNHDRASICSDTYAFDLEGLYGNEGEFPEILPHPHTYCVFPKYILEYGMETLEKTIWKITGAIAEFLNIKQRGTIKEDNYADIVVIDLNNLKTNENYVEPRVYPDGIDYVFVNGKEVVDKSGYKKIRVGKILKK